MNAHVEGMASYGHYLVDLDGRCKLFAFDIDLDKSATWNGQTFDPRAAWAGERSPIKDRLQRELRALAEGLAYRVHDVLDVPCAVSYSGSKGVHVYALTGLRPATEVREAAVECLDNGAFQRHQGEAFWKHRSAFQAMTVEVFPKQTSVREDGYGNLMRMPLGRNLKGKAACFLKLSAPSSKFVADDPEKVLAFGSIR